MSFLELTPQSEGLTIAPLVALGYCDLCGGGVRALCGLQPKTGETCRQWSVKVSGLQACSITTGADGDRTSPGVLQVNTFYDSQGSPIVSILVLLAAVPSENQMLVADAIVSFLEEKVGQDLRLVISAAMRLPETCDSAKPYFATLNGAEIDGTWETLPANTRLQDGMIAGLVHLCTARAVKTTLIVVSGHRLSKIADSNDESHIKVVQTLGEAGAQVLGCHFDKLRLKDLDIVSLSHWNDYPHDGIPMYT
ncbi:hypothetical protein CYMTET_55510 [Cymbomonas tetramitiformis]|uniref:Uncharacterized protein n=1 Tax=Cymbomonas tetramitiformis TaxID=36881 RepID=A0AAE0BE75_9CHLO|nr:hypothetical protein CYMTET_55510 [Cymbomonas tetramitiformis]